MFRLLLRIYRLKLFVSKKIGFVLTLISPVRGYVFENYELICILYLVESFFNLFFFVF